MLASHNLRMSYTVYLNYIKNTVKKAAKNTKKKIGSFDVLTAKQDLETDMNKGLYSDASCNWIWKPVFMCVHPQDWSGEVCCVLPALGRENFTEWRERGKAFTNGNSVYSAEKPLPSLAPLQHTCSLHEQYLWGTHKHFLFPLLWPLHLTL